MGADDYPALLQSVKKNGVQVPVELLSEEEAEKRGERAGTVLDGPRRIPTASLLCLEVSSACFAGLLHRSTWVLKVSAHVSQTTRLVMLSWVAGLFQRADSAGAFRLRPPTSFSYRASVC